MDDFVQDLEEQVGFLLKSTRDFDDGDLPEAKRLATTIRTLVHQTATSHALLNQCGVLPTMHFGDSARAIHPGNMLSSDLLTSRINGGAGWQYTPSRGPIRQWIPFEDWWRAPIVSVPSRASEPNPASEAPTTITRRYIVLELANTDGGTHVGPKKRKYEDFSRHSLLGWSGRRGEDTYSLGNPALATVRQITHEILNSVERQFPGLVREQIHTLLGKK